MTVDMDVHYTLVFRLTSCAVRCVSSKTFSVCFYQVKFFYVFPIRIPKISEIYNCVFVTQLATTPPFFYHIPENGYYSVERETGISYENICFYGDRGGAVG